MTSTSFDGASAAQRVADRLKVAGPWEVFADEARRYEVHLTGTKVELVRGPLTLEGYGLRLLRARNGRTSTGFQSSTDFSDAGIRAVATDAEGIVPHTDFPAASVTLPSAPSVPPPRVEIEDPRLAGDPAPAVEEYLAELRNNFPKGGDAAPSFGSIKITHARTSMANSAGLSASYTHTLVQVEMAVKASGGPEGRPPGEYWVDTSSRRLDLRGLAHQVDGWCRRARDARVAVGPPTGALPVVLPPEVLGGILPDVIGYRASGSARLRKLGLEVGSSIGAASVNISDDGMHPWAVASAPFDAEGTPSRRTAILERGSVASLLYDSMHGAAFKESSTGNSVRAGVGPGGWFRFTNPPSVGSTTLVVGPGDGGSDAELCEQAGDGVWVQQLGWANPDPISGAFGGEIRIGYRIHHGKLAEPVRGGIVGGLVFGPPKAPSLLANVAAVGSKLGAGDDLASPALLVRPLTVAGK